MITHYKLPHKVRTAGFITEQGKLLYTVGRNSHVRVFDIKTKKVERKYKYPRYESGTIWNHTSDFIFASGIYKTFVYGINDDVTYTYPRSGDPAMVQDDRYFIFWVPSDYKDNLPADIICFDTHSCEYMKVGETTLDSHRPNGLFRDRYSNTHYKGTSKLNTNTMRMEFDVEELKFDGLIGKDLTDVLSIGEYYVVQLSNGGKHNIVQFFDVNMSMLAELKFEKYASISAGYDGKTVYILSENIVSKVDVATRETVSKVEYPANISVHLMFENYHYLIDEKADEHFLVNLRTMNRSKLQGADFRVTWDKHYMACISSCGKEVSMVDLTVSEDL